MIIRFDKTKPLFADVSHYRLVQDEAAFAAASEAAGILGFKVNEGAFNDKTMQRNIDICERHGLVQLGYEYDHDGRADNFLRRFPPLFIGATDGMQSRIPCLDAEATDLTLKEAEKWIQAVADAYGFLPWVYGRQWFITQGARNIAESAVAQCPFWGSQYGPALYVPAGIKRENVVAWQFTDGVNGPFAAPRRFDGIGNCDINLLLKPVSVPRAIASGSTCAITSFSG